MKHMIKNPWDAILSTHARALSWEVDGYKTRTQQREIIAYLRKRGLVIHDSIGRKMPAGRYPVHCLTSFLSCNDKGYPYLWYSRGVTSLGNPIDMRIDYHDEPHELLWVLHEALISAHAYQQLERLTTYTASLLAIPAGSRSICISSAIEYVHNCMVDAEVVDNLMLSSCERILGGGA